MKILVATRSVNKLKEYQELLSDFEALDLNDISSIPSSFEVIENGQTFKQNATLKAQGYGQFSTLPALADDSGLVIDHLNGQPGIYSARFAKGDYLTANQKIIKLLEGQPKEKRTARFIIAIALYDPQTKLVKTFQATIEGYISDQPKGSNGFGYDPIFFSPELNKTFGQASTQEKKRYSHRSKAVKKLTSYLSKIKNDRH